MAQTDRVAIVLSGGIGLGAYQAGAYAELHREPRCHPHWLAASSAGAINAALIAGSPPDQRIGQLRRFWTTADPPFVLAQALWGQWRHLHSWMSALRGRLFGVQSHFHPRVTISGRPFQSLYDLAPMRDRLGRMVDFDRLNSGSVRVTVATTDVVSGETVLFDTGRGVRIGVDHLLASCGFLPEFAPVDIDGRLLGDGGLSANAPVEAVLFDNPTDEDNSTDERLLCFIIDLYARDGARPNSFEEALARKGDLLFGNQPHLQLAAVRRENDLRLRMERLSALVPKERLKRPEVVALAREVRARRARIAYLSYRAPPQEAGSERPYDLSPASMELRWRAGALDMAEALRVLSDTGDRLGTTMWTIRRADHDDETRTRTSAVA